MPMATWTAPEYEILYLNPDGSWVSGFKAYQDAPAFAFYPQGYAVALALIE